MSIEHFDVLVVGAGLSGIGAGYHLQTKCPGKRFAILEGRGESGGTWSLFRYPGVRSDSDMFTLGYGFRPWTQAKSIADGASILDYLRETAAEFGIHRHIRFHHKVTHAAWSSETSRWTLEIQAGPEGRAVRYSCDFLYLCSGYYSYDRGYTPELPGIEHFKGRVVHPQDWPKDLDYSGQRVVVIGSGATAMTLVPAMSERAAHVTMLQRSPTYVISQPAHDALANLLRQLLPSKAAHAVVRAKNIAIAQGLYQLCRRAPRLARRLLRSGVARELPKGFDVATHFTPRYAPWDQRLCLVPDADLFKALRRGSASVVTDHIDRFTERGVRLKSGAELDADLVVTATGLRVLACGGIGLQVDGRRVDLARAFVYRGLMFSGLPNLALCTGYTNLPWTLRAELSSRFVCRLLNHMQRHGHRKVVATCDEASMDQQPLLDLTSGYVQRALAQLPRQGTKLPWRMLQNYLLDRLVMRRGLRDRALVFSRPEQPPHAQDLRDAREPGLAQPGLTRSQS